MATKHPHTKLVEKILLKLSDKYSKSRYYKNPVGAAFYKDCNEWVKYGLTPGANDIIGFTSVIVTNDMVGKRVAVFTGIEAKTGDATTKKNQDDFIEAVTNAGGISGVAHSPEGAENLIKEWKF